jgi:NADH dehydrogenase
MKLAAALLDWLPIFPVTRDQLTMLAEGNTVDPAALAQLIGRQPKAFNEAHLAYLRN